MGNQQETAQFQMGWLSGVIDGEGCFGFDVQRAKGYEWYRPSFQLGNTDKRLIDRVAAIFESMGLAYHITTHQPKGKAKRAYLLQVPGMKRIKRLLDRIYPFLVIKQERAKILLDYIALRESKPYNSPYGEDEERLVTHLRQMNFRGIAGPSETARQTPTQGEDTVRAA